MIQSLLALLGRSLRVDSRSLQVHLARIGLMAAINVALIFALVTSNRFGAPGLRFFRSIFILDVLFVVLMGIGFFATAITEEKEEDTLGLMQMAGINPLGILLGKLGGRLWQALLLLAVQYPFTLLAVTLGGITRHQIQSAFVGLTSFMLLLAGLGMLCSTVAPRSRAAATMMVLGLLMYFAIPYAAGRALVELVTNGLLARASTWHAVLSATSGMCLFLQIGPIMTTSYTESVWSLQAISNGIGGLLCFLLAWGLFAPCTRNPATESTSRGLLANAKSPYRLFSRLFSPGRPGINPFLWKEFYFVGGGIGMVLARLLFYLGLLIVSIILGDYWWGAVAARYPYQYRIGFYQFLLLVITTIEATVLATRTLHDEVRGRTLASLVMLPESVPRMVYSKFAGALLAGLPGLCCLAIASLCTPAGRYHTEEFLEEAAGWFFLAHFVLVPHLSTVLGLYLRWGSIPLSIGISIASVFCWIQAFQAASVGPRDEFVWVATLVVLANCVGVHVWIALALPRVAAEN